MKSGVGSQVDVAADSGKQSPDFLRRALWTRPQRLFLILSISFGVPLALLTAPFQAADETHHFLRAYQVSEGGFIPVHRGNVSGGDMPLSISRVILIYQRLRSHDWETTGWAEIKSTLQIPLEPWNREYKPFPMAIYSPISYLSQATAILIGRAAGCGPVSLMYLARLANLLVWIALGYAAIATAPTLGRPLLLLLLMPMSLFQAASVSGDAFTNGLAALFTATIWRHAFAKRSPEATMTRTDFTNLLVMTMALSLTKFAFWPLAALVLLVPAERFGGRRRRAAAVGVLGAGGLAAVLSWAPCTQGLDASILDRPDVNARQQVAFLVAHPSAIASIALQTLRTDGPFLVRSFVGRLGSVDIRLPAVFIAPYLVAMALACWPARALPPRPQLKRVFLVVMISVSLAFAAVAFLNYLFWTPVAAAHVRGMQGRHLIPLAPAIIVLLSVLLARLSRPKRIAITEGTLDAAVALIAIVTCGYTLFSVYQRYYVAAC